MPIPTLSCALDAGRGKHADVVDQSLQGALVRRESIALGVEVHGV
jgi:hypothetical protein